MASSSRLRRYLSKDLLLFFIIAYGITWLTWLPMILHDDALKYLHYLGSLGPLIAAFIMKYRSEGTSGIKSQWRQIIKWRVRYGWYILVIFGPLVLFCFGSFLSRLFNQAVAWDLFWSSKEFLHIGLWLIPLEILFYGFGEEVGWRGYAIPKLEETGLSSYHASSVFSFFWAAWHLPLFWYAYGLQSMPLLMIPGWFISILLSSYLITWVFNSAGKSLLIVAIFHGMVDVALTSRANTNITIIFVNASLIIASVYVVRVYGQALDTSSHQRRIGVKL